MKDVEQRGEMFLIVNWNFFYQVIAQWKYRWWQYSKRDQYIRIKVTKTLDYVSCIDVVATDAWYREIIE